MTDMPEELARQIEERKQAAQDKKIAEKAWCIPQYLPTPRPMTGFSGNDRQRRYSTAYDDIQLEINAYKGRNIRGPGPKIADVWYADDHVFSARDPEMSTTIERYIPGDWEEKIDELYEEAEDAKESYEWHQHRAEIHEAARTMWEETDKWGIDP